MIKTFLMVIFLMTQPGDPGRQAYVVPGPQFNSIPACQYFVQQSMDELNAMLADRYGTPKEISEIFCVERSMIPEFMESQGLAPLKAPLESTPGLAT